MKNKVFIAVTIFALVLAGVLVFSFKKGIGLTAAKFGAGKNVLALVAQAKGLELKGNLLGAKNAYQELINNYPGSKDIMEWQKENEGLNIKLLFSPAITPKSTLYEIKPGDSIAKIAREFKTTPDLIIKSNNLTGGKIFPGRKIKIWNAPFMVVVDRSQNILMLKSDEEVIKTYIVSTGKNNSTPTGTHRIVNKLKDPTWFKAGAVVASGSPDNVLGTRWMGFDVPGYGIHGTTNPQNLGKQVTEGCVRMNNSEVEELYTILPVGTEVTIVD